MPSILTARLPIRFSDALAIEVDADAGGKTITPAQAMALGEHLIHLAARRQADQRRTRAAVPATMLVRLKVVA